MNWRRQKKTRLTVRRLRWALDEFEPHVNYRYVTSLLNECCSADAKDTVILECVRELIENFGADPNLGTIPDEGSLHGVTPLIIASARAIPSVVRYLLDAGASPFTIGNAKFTWEEKGSRNVKGSHTPLEFAREMREAEIAQWGAWGEDSEDALLDECIALLEEAENSKHGST